MRQTLPPPIAPVARGGERLANLFDPGAVRQGSQRPRSRQMQPSYKPKPTHLLTAIALLSLALPSLASAGPTSKQVVKQVDNAALGKTVLTTTKGRTLYSLSAETNGRFICTASCLTAWHPLVVPAGTKPTGPVKLGTIERPDSRTQVTFKGKPLYSFSGDTKAGEANGEGIKDVGTWHAAASGKTAPQPEAPQPQPEPTYPY
jgi:predicted lipoprotein with Yx(FWY)xxD motif